MQSNIFPVFFYKVKPRACKTQDDG